MTDATIHSSAVVLTDAIGVNVQVGALACVAAGAVLGNGAHVGEGAVVSPGVRIGDHARVEPGAVVTHDVPANAVVRGHPAIIVGYVDAPARASEARLGTVTKAAPGVSASEVRGVQLHHLREVQDMRGYLCAAEFDSNLPFVPRRCFWVYAVPNQQIRGEHAHRRCAQYLVAVTGSLRVVADDGERREEFSLDRPSLGLYLPPMTWGIQYGYSEDAVLMVLASDPYEPQDYIRDYSEFRRLAQSAAPQS
ncbi:WxcM-like domain-containing protein [Ottowia thiooxydans]|uniref:WxcM-like domain-containing protein n=1 Tax=Ottowia thiooxydans TaxID=219182 RepID=UPI0004051791|nr:WxcM-like domain-containing protein [Ottowia thiooxydans]